MNMIRWIIPIAALVAVDQISKYWVETTLPLYQRIEVIPFLSLYRTYNEGVAFSFLSGLGSFPLIILTIAIILFILWLWRSLEPGRWLSALGYALVVAGAFGNLIDRIRLGKVV
ncbi:MAG: signal peptidase II, partial [Pseudomonadota bacterium]